jgi:hypothetical protein
MGKMIWAEGMHWKDGEIMYIPAIANILLFPFEFDSSKYPQHGISSSREAKWMRTEQQSLGPPMLHMSWIFQISIDAFDRSLS